MPELKMVSPLLSNMEVVERVSVRGGTSVYIVQSTKTKTCYLLKHISVPESQRQVDALLYTGAVADKDAAQKYFQQVVSEYRGELELLEMLSSSSNIDSYRSYQIEPKTDEVGFDIYLLGENRKTLDVCLEEKPMTHLCAVNFALDICNALIDLRQAGLIHRDVKPSNIYLNSQEHFVLGDLGLAKIDDLKYCVLPESMLSTYSAPELFDLVGSMDKTIDVYALGLILYRIYNGGHAPFEDEQNSAKAADRRRITGEELPAPMYADYEMTEILHKACAFKPADRYQDPAELRDALVEYVRRNHVEDTLIVPPIVVDEEEPAPVPEAEEIEPVQFADTEELSEDFKQSFSPDTEMLNAIIDSVHRDMEREAEKQPEELPDEDEEAESAPVRPGRKRRSRRLALILSAVGVLVAAAALVYFLVIAPRSVFVNGISVVSCGSSEAVLRVDSHEASGEFNVVCSDAYGNAFRQPYVKGQDVRFDNLAPGTQYTVSIEPLNDKKLSGTPGARFSTETETEVLSFTVTPVSLTQVELNLTLNGPEPDAWTVSYSDGEQGEQEITFSGHSATVANLSSGKNYTFELLEPAQTHLVGVRSASYSTVPTVNIDKTTVAISSTSAILSWTITGDEPEYWTVSVTGPDGFEQEQQVTSPAVTIDGLTSGTEYEVVISAPTMLQDGFLTITPTVTSVSDLTVEQNDDGNYHVSWSCTSENQEKQWTLFCTPKGAERSAGLSVSIEDAEAYTIDAAELIPETTYTVSLELANGDILDGSTKSEFTTPEAKNYHKNGFESGYIGLYQKPDADTFTAKDLAVARSKFASDQAVAFAIQAIGSLELNDGDVSLLYVIRNAENTVIDACTKTVNWAEMWDNSLFADFFPRTPSRSGTYVLQIYFDGEYVVKGIFEVE